MFGDNFLRAYKGYKKGEELRDLEAQRKLKIQQMQQQIAITGNQEYRAQQQFSTNQQKAQLGIETQQLALDKTKEAYARQEDKNDAQLEMLKKEIYKTQAMDLDNTILETFKTGDYNKINRVFTNDTEDNPHILIKRELDKAVGGKVTKVEPNPDKENDGMEALLNVYLKNGDNIKIPFDLDGFAQRVGTPRRVGYKTYKDTLLRASTNPTTGAVNIPELYKNALIGAKNGDQGAKDVVKALKSYMELGKNGKPVPITEEDVTTAMLEAVQNGDKDQFDIATKQYEMLMKLNTLKQKMNPKATQKPLTPKQRMEMEDKQLFEGQKQQLQQIAPTKINEGNIGKVQSAVSNVLEYGKPSENMVRMRAADIYSIMRRNDEATDKLNPLSNQWLSGKVDRTIDNTLKVLDQLEKAAPRTNIQQKAIDEMSLHTRVVKYANNLRKGYSQIKEELGEVQRNFGTQVADRVQKSVGQFVHSLFNPNNPPTTKQLKSLATEADKLYAVLTNPNTSKKEKELARETIKTKFRMEASTEGFLLMKDMLKLISGAGVTNEELERYSKEFVGTDFTDLEGVIQTITASAKSSMQNFNVAFSNGLNSGLYGTAYKKLADVRANSQLLRREWGDDAYTNGIDDLRLYPPELMTKESEAVLSKVKDQNVRDFVTNYVKDEYNYRMNNGGSLEGFDPTANDKLFKMASPERKKLMLDTLKAYKKATTNGTIERPKREEGYKSIGVTDIPKPIIDYIDKFETSTGSYYEDNKTSTAYGRYQMLKDVREPYLKQLGYTDRDFKNNPEVQDEVFSLHYEDMTKALKRMDKPLTKENIYTVHQLGAGRARRYFEGNLTKEDLAVMWDNVPDKLKEGIPKGSDKILPIWVNRYRGGKR